MRTLLMQTTLIAASTVGHATAFSSGGVGCHGGVCSGVHRRRERLPTRVEAPTSNNDLVGASSAATASSGTALRMTSTVGPWSERGGVESDGDQYGNAPSTAGSGLQFASGRGSVESEGESGGDQYANNPPPSTFREAEVMGLRMMQDGRHEEALKAFQQALKLPGSRPDFIRTANVAGPSPVGGAMGGTAGRTVMNLDESEYQAVHYNMACASACVGNVGESISNLKKAFDYGFDLYSAVRADPDLSNVHSTTEFEKLMEEYESQGGFNPFGVFRKK